VQREGGDDDREQHGHERSAVEAQVEHQWFVEPGTD
jgi:hypothetical protein